MTWAVIVEILKAASAWLQYMFSPEMIKRRDEINAALTKGKNKDEIDQMFGGKNTVGIGYFLSESLRELRAKEANPAAGWETSFSDRILPKGRRPEDRDSDPKEGF